MLGSFANSYLTNILYKSFASLHHNSLVILQTEVDIPTIFTHITHNFPTDGVSTLSWWWGLSAPETLRAMLVVALLLVGSPMLDRSRGRSQTKRDTLVLKVGGWA
jgi:hypothetical protein